MNEDMSDDNNNTTMEAAAADKAYEAISATLASWTSPKMLKGNRSTALASNSNNNNNNDRFQVTEVPNANYKYERDSMEWWNRELIEQEQEQQEQQQQQSLDEEDDIDMDLGKEEENRSTVYSPVASTTKPKQSKNNYTTTPMKTLTERAATPVMSNSSSTKKKKSKITPTSRTPAKLNDGDEDEDDEESTMLPVNVQSPWLQQQPKSQQKGKQQPFQDSSTGTHLQFNQSSPSPTGNRQQQQQQQRSASKMVSATPQQNNKNRQNHRHHDDWLGLQRTSPRSIAPFKNQSYEYRRYHDALLVYVKARKNLNQRIQLDLHEKQLSSSLALSDTAAAAAGITDSRNLTEEETRIELDFLWALNSLCWERSDSEHHHQRKCSATAAMDTYGNSQHHHPHHCSRREGDFWLLLCDLRKLGLDSLIYSDQNQDLKHSNQLINTYIQHKAKNIHATPLQLIMDLDADPDQKKTNSNESPPCPLVLKRRKQILRWMEHCFEQLLPEPARTALLGKKATSTSYDDVAGLITSKNSPAQSNITNSLLMKSCLALILAGRLDDARQMTRRCGQAWRAASWGGGAPSGYKTTMNDTNQTIEKTNVGNVHRALWKRQMQKLSEQLHQRQGPNAASAGGDGGPDSSEAASDEAAIHALLSNDYHNALNNPSLRSWEKGLYAIYTSMWGRLEDEILHLHNQHRRQYKPPFPGTRYEKQELEQLQATSDLIGMTESKALDLLKISIFDEISSCENYLSKAISAFLVGETAITDYLNGQDDSHQYFHRSYQNMNENDNEEQEDGDEDDIYVSDSKVAHLRFITHLVLYLDSLSVCTTPIIFDDEKVNEFKNHVLYVYVHHLANHEDLRHMMPLYASLLPQHLLLQCFPKLLIRVQEEEERKQMLQQTRDLIGNGITPQLDLIILRKVVTYILSEQDPDDENNNYDSNEISMISPSYLTTTQLLKSPFLPTTTTNNDQRMIEAATGEEEGEMALVPTLGRKPIYGMVTDDEDDNENADDDNDGGIANGMDNNITITPSNTDIRKMKSIQWLCFYQEHMGDALMFSNSLLRQFLLGGKIQSAISFVQDYLPEDVLEKAVIGTSGSDTIMDTDNDDDDDDDDDIDFERKQDYKLKQQQRIDHARSEHLAYQAYLNAYRSVEIWQEVLSTTPATCEIIDEQLDMINNAFAANADGNNNNNEMEEEKKIISSMERRNLIRQKRKASHIVVEVADIARRDLLSVLTHPGGWLYFEETDTANDPGATMENEIMDDNGDSNEEGQKEQDLRRNDEIQSLRSKFLPHVISMFQRVCIDTAEWMSNSLDDAIPELGKTPLEVLQQLDDSASVAATSLSLTNNNATTAGSTGDEDTNTANNYIANSQLSPKYWIRTIGLKTLAECIITDRLAIKQAFEYNNNNIGQEQLKQIFTILSDMKLTDLMYSA